jgi:hypothetical protein
MSTAQPGTRTIPRRNQRRCRRQVPKGSTKIRACNNALGLGKNIAVAVLDISETGIRLLLKQPLKVGKEFEVILEGPGTHEVKLLARVIWTVETSDGQHCIGASFAKPIGYSDLQALSRM